MLCSDIALCCAMLRYILLSCATLSYIVPYGAPLCHVLLRHAMFCYVSLCCAMWYHVVLCYDMLSHVAHDMLLPHIALCSAILYHVATRFWIKEQRIICLGVDKKTKNNLYDVKFWVHIFSGSFGSVVEKRTRG